MADNLNIADENDNVIAVDIERISAGNAYEEMEYDILVAGQPHAFCIPSIVSDLLNYFPIRDLEKLREVSTLWNEEACKILRKKKLVELHDSESVGRYNSRFAETNDFPHQNYQIWNDDITDTDPKIRRFFEIFGLHIKSLDFHQLYLDGEVVFEILSSKVPNLETLTILNVPRGRVTTIEGGAGGGGGVSGAAADREVLPPPRDGPSCSSRSIQRMFPKIKTINLIRFPLDHTRSRTFLINLFSSCPNLEKLTIAKQETTGLTEPVSIEGIGKFVVELLINSNQPMNHLSYLGFPFRLKEEIIQPMCDKAFPITTLELSLDSNVKSRSFTTLMAVLSRTLDDLSVTFNGNSSLLSNVPSTHLNVTSLTLTSFQGSLSFIYKMINLKNLTLHGVDLSTSLPVRGFQNIGNGQDIHNLVSFKSSGDSSDRDVVSRITCCFPNLHALHLSNLGDEGLGIIYRESPFLEKLVCTDGTFTDSGLSGVPQEVCNDLWETMTIYDVNPERFRRDLFIGSLPHLRYLKLDSPAMTDLAIMFGIVGCTKLSTLCLKSFKITDVSMPAIGEMRKLTLLDISYCPEVSEAGKFILKQKLEGRRLIFDPPSNISSAQRRARRIRASEIHEREIERLGIHRDRLVEVARAREVQLQVAYRLFNQLQHLENEPAGGAVALGVRHPRHHHFIRQVVRGWPRDPELNRADIAQLLDIVHLDNMDNVDFNDNEMEQAGAVGPNLNLMDVHHHDDIPDRDRMMNNREVMELLGDQVEQEEGEEEEERRLHRFMDVEAINFEERNFALLDELRGRDRDLALDDAAEREFLLNPSPPPFL